MNSSRAALDRILDPSNRSVTVQPLARAAQLLGKRRQISIASPYHGEKGRGNGLFSFKLAYIHEEHHWHLISLIDRMHWRCMDE